MLWKFHDRIFDARNHLDRTAAVVTGLDIDLEHALQPLRPCHRNVAGWRRISSSPGLAPAALGRRHLFLPPVIRRKDAVVACEVDARRRLPKAARRAIKSKGSKTTSVVPSRYGVFKRPNKTVTMHNHLAQTNMLIMQGELRMYEPDGSIREVRPAGHYYRGRTDDAHSEGGGPDGAVVFYSMRCDEIGRAHV